MSQWISVKDKLPNDGETVLILIGKKIEVARIEFGISTEQREKMKLGELPDKETYGYVPGRPPFRVKRSELIAGPDEFGNNKVPYKWYAQSGPMQWFGQNVSYWMVLPELPETK